MHVTVRKRTVTTIQNTEIDWKLFFFKKGFVNYKSLKFALTCINHLFFQWKKNQCVTIAFWLLKWNL